MNAVNPTKRVTFLVGSPRGLASTSESLGTYVLLRLAEHGFETEKTYATWAVTSDRNRADLLQLIDGTDLLILAFPLYVDSLPCRLVAALELIADHRKTTTISKRQRLVDIVNSGFPEARQNDIALGICRCFAEEAGFDWVGGLALGGGGMIAGRALCKVGGAARNVMRALDLTAKAIAEGEPVPKEAVQLMARPMIPRWLYVWISNRRWNREMKKYGTSSKLYDQPYPVTPISA